MNVPTGVAPYSPTVIPLPRVLVKKTRKLAWSALALAMGLCGIVLANGAETAREVLPAEDDEGIPQPLQTEVFAALMASPPFTRSLNLSDSLVLTGVATAASVVLRAASTRDRARRKSIASLGWRNRHVAAGSSIADPPRASRTRHTAIGISARTRTVTRRSGWEANMRAASSNRSATRNFADLDTRACRSDNADGAARRRTARLSKMFDIPGRRVKDV